MYVEAGANGTWECSAPALAPILIKQQRIGYFRASAAAKAHKSPAFNNIRSSFDKTNILHCTHTLTRRVE